MRARGVINLWVPVALLAVGGAAGCGADKPGSQTAAAKVAAPPSATKTATAPTASPTVEASGSAIEPFLTAQPTCQDKTFTGPAAAKFGADRVTAGYRFAVKFVIDATFDDSLMNNLHPRPEDFTFVEKDMTASAKASWGEAVALALKPNSTKQQFFNVVALTSYNIVNPSKGEKPTTPAFRDAACGPATAGVGTDSLNQPALTLRFNITGKFLTTGKDGQPLARTLRKRMTMNLSRTGVAAAPWAVDKLSANTTYSDNAPDDGK